MNNHANRYNWLAGGPTRDHPGGPGLGHGGPDATLQRPQDVHRNEASCRPSRTSSTPSTPPWRALVPPPYTDLYAPGRHPRPDQRDLSLKVTSLGARSTGANNGLTAGLTSTSGGTSNPDTVERAIVNTPRSAPDRRGPRRRDRPGLPVRDGGLNADFALVVTGGDALTLTMIVGPFRRRSRPTRPRPSTSRSSVGTQNVVPGSPAISTMQSTDPYVSSPMTHVQVTTTCDTSRGISQSTPRVLHAC